MFKLYRKEDNILLFLLVILIIAVAILFFKDNIFNSKEKIIIDQTTTSSQLEDKKVEQNSNQELEKKEEDIIVHLGGAVQNPGVYQAKSGVRIYQLLKMAGGAKDDADLDSINLVMKVVKDGRVVIPYHNKSPQLSSSKSNKININLATTKQLEKLKGVGPATAAKIIEYRESKGAFNKLEDLMKVSGIGPKTFDKLKDQITN